MGHEALEDALAKYRGKPIQKDEGDRIVCQCYGTTEKKLRQIVQENDIKTVADATNFCKTGGGCGRCHDDVQKIIDEENKKKNQKSESVTLTKTQMIIKVNNVLENYVSEELRKDGGDIELIDVDGNNVFVKLHGACKNCPSSSLTLKNFVENVLKEHINPEIKVIDNSF